MSGKKAAGSKEERCQKISTRRPFSGGLIIEWEPKKVWKWRHPFVGIYLAQLVKQGEDNNE